MPPTYTTPSGELHLSKEAFDRLCERCDSMFKSLSDVFVHDARSTYYCDTVPFGSWDKLLNSACKGDCHFCCSLVAQVLASEKAHLITGQDTKRAEHIYPFLQPVVSQPGVLRTVTEPVIDTSSPVGDKALVLKIQYFHLQGVFFNLDIVGEDTTHVAYFYDELRAAYRARQLPTSLNTGSEASFAQALRWVDNCVSSHPSCNKMVLGDFHGRYPARFVDVGCVGSPTVKIRETTGLDFRKQRYMTLSHCWGDSVPTQLLLENYDSRLMGFALAELPRTFQDAILITRKLNVQFLWIDSLCIIQDSPGDWGTESAQMRFVYQNTYLNLAAGASPNPRGGFFYPRYPLSFVPWEIALSSGRILGSWGMYGPEKERLILNTRGWVLQEQILARRTLIFGKQELYWECSMGEASECFPDSVDPSGKYSHSKRAVTSTTLIELSRGKLPHDSERHRVWALLVKEYSGRRLTKQSDKLVAISGLAEILSSGWNDITYHAGLWSYCLRQNLLWRCEKIKESKARNMDVAPSWSWASLNAECSLAIPSPHDAGVDGLAAVLEAMVTLSTPMHLFGQVSGGTVRIKGPLLRSTVRYRSHSPQDSIGGWWESDADEECASVVHVLAMNWDEKETRDLAVAQSAMVYLAPLEVHLRFPAPGIWHLGLKGLFLRPALASRQKGKFERLGVFNISDSFNRRRPRGRFNPYRSKVQSTLEESGSDRPKQAQKEFSMVYSTDELFPQLTSGSEEERAALLRSDPYLNGPLNTNLKRRYSPELEPEHYPKLGRLFEALELAAQHNRESDNPDENLGKDEGNGYYIYELV